MSAYHQSETTMTDRDVLVDSLKEMKMRSGRKCDPKVNQEKQALEGYQGDKRKQLADVIIPRSQVGTASNDIGFEKVDGNYVAHISQYDSSFYNKKWLGELKTVYAKKHAHKIAKKNGLTFLGEKKLPNGKTRMQFSKA